MGCTLPSWMTGPRGFGLGRTEHYLLIGLVICPTPETGLKKFPGSAESLDFSDFVMILEGPFGATMVDLRPSRPHHPPKEGFPAPRFFRESSGARLGPDFGRFREKCEGF